LTALFPLRNFTALEYASEFLVGAASIDIAVFGIEVKYTPAFAAAIAAKHIIAEQHIQMSASIIAKGASALPLRLGSPHYGNAKQVNNLCYTAWQVTRFAHTHTSQRSVQLAIFSTAFSSTVAPAFSAMFLPA
jgi:hypothetical protein